MYKKGNLTLTKPKAAIKEIEAALAQIEKAEREWRNLSEEARLKLKLEKIPKLASSSQPQRTSRCDSSTARLPGANFPTFNR